MTDPTRPQPVLDEAKAAGLIQACFIAGAGLFFTVKGGISADTIVSVGNALNLFITAALAAAAYFVPIIRGKTAAAQVTPLEDPQTYGGQPLMTAEQWIQQDQYGEHAGRSTPMSRPVPSPRAVPYEPYQQLKANADALDTPIYAATAESELNAMAPVEPEPEPEPAVPSQPDPMEAWAQRVLSRKSDSAEDKAVARAYLDSLTAGK